MRDVYNVTAPTRTINIVTGSGGGGHNATYRAIRARLEQRQKQRQEGQAASSDCPVLAWRFQVTNMDDVMVDMTEQKGSVDVYKWIGGSVSAIYNSMLERGWTWLWPVQMRLNKWLVKLNAHWATDYFKAYWQSQQPDLVVSVVTMCNKVLWQALNETLPGAPYVTVAIDFADVPPGFWIEPETDSYMVCGTQRLVEQSRQLGVSPERIVPTAGMVIHPSFQPRPCDSQSLVQRARQRTELGLSPDTMTCLVMFGGNGAKSMVEIAQKLERFGPQVQLIFLCGHSEEVRSQLNEQFKQSDTLQRRIAVGFTSDMPDYMALADFFIGKPGPGSLSEAMAMNLPVITERNFSTLIHERYNADWVEENKMGIVLKSFSQIDSAVAQFLQPDIFERYLSSVQTYRNSAVDDVCHLLESLMEQSLIEESSVASNDSLRHPTAAPMEVS